MELDTPKTVLKAPMAVGKPFLSAKVKIGLIIICLITLGSGLYFLPKLISKTSQQISHKDPFKVEALTLTDAAVNKQVKEKLNAVLQSDSNDETKELLFKAFFLVAADYQTLPTEAKRNAMTLIHDYYAQRFPDQAKNLEPIPCREEACGYKVVDNEEIKALRAKVFQSQESNKINPTAVDILRRNLDDAAVAASSGDKINEYQSLRSFFLNLRTSTESIRTAVMEGWLNETLRILSKLDQARYQLEEQKGSFKL